MNFRFNILNAGILYQLGASQEPMVYMEKVTYKYSYIWIIVSRWRGFHAALHRDFPLLNNGISTDYRNRLITSAVRGASLMYILSRSTNKPFDRFLALSTGLLSALFDDMIDDYTEDFPTIRQLIFEPQNILPETHQGKIARELYLALLDRLLPWQKQQLTGVLSALLEIEKVVKVKRNGEWKKRGTYAFYVYLTLIQVPLEQVNQGVANKYGEYLQLLDDYEDFHSDDPHDNFFKTHPGFDFTGYYMEEIRPLLPTLFSFDFDRDFFCNFVDTYHYFQFRSHRNHHQEEKFPDPLKRKFFRYVVRKLNGNVPF